ncbi:hypothetical protein MTR67_034960 [Solanum verrucosum]|uniref:Uncharacterized protein n=1 Tax=Solanum verrucosum TaxID=315347 RepID=A0AAF0U8Z8_SOLVR|nr:hypothetical protein MTR67_034960 [Solanum verrucosum]
MAQNSSCLKRPNILITGTPSTGRRLRRIPRWC